MITYMKKLFVLFLIFSFIGCGSDVSCDSSGAKDTVKELVQINVINNAYEFGFRFGEAMGLPLLTDEKYSGYMDGSVEIPTPKIKIKNIRITSYNEKTKFYSCQADLEYTWNDRLVKDLKLIKYISLGTINRLLGGIFSSLKFVIIIVSISMVINYFSELLAIEIIPSDQINKSTVYPILISIGDLLLEVLNNKSLTI